MHIRNSETLTRGVRRGPSAAVSLVILLSFVLTLFGPSTALASNAEGDGAGATDTSDVIDISADGDAARIEGCDYAVEGFARSQTGSGRAIDGVEYGYTYRLDAEESLIVVNTAEYAVVYVRPDVCEQFGIDLKSNADTQMLKDYLVPLDNGLSQGSTRLAFDQEWFFTSDDRFEVDGIFYEFGRTLKEDYRYVVISSADAGIDIRDTVDPKQMDVCMLVDASSATIASAGSALDQLGDFLAHLDYSPLWVTLKTTGTAIIFIFILGLAAAYFTLRVPPKVQSILDSIFTIPMVLPPTVCGFLLLMLLGRNTALGRWFIDIGFPLIFSWQATVIAAVVVAFPLMYRSARGAFENLDPNMLDAARTLGWSNARIFFKLMLPLAWSSIAAGTVLSFARALGEFGATLFLAGNQLGTTRTIPIAIYFEWMNGNQAATWFWTITLIVFSFVVILFINLWSRHTTKYRRPNADEG